MPLLEPELGAVGVLGAVVELPLVPPLAAPAPDLSKWASHSERETWPSLLVSIAEKLGAELLALLDELCARATLDSANNAAAVAALTTLSLNIW
jgi:hypothetical protein